MNPVHLPRPLVDQILWQAQQSPEREICGLIGARDGIPAHGYAVANVDPHPEHHFLMSPAQQIAAMRRMRERGEELFAIYHSHPDAPARPSDEDLRQAAYPDALYLIVSLATEGAPELRAFRLKDHAAQAVDLGVE